MIEDSLKRDVQFGEKIKSECCEKIGGKSGKCMMGLRESWVDL